MDIRLILGILAGVLTVAGGIPYFISILKGNTKPERAANLIWGITTGVTFFAYWADGAKDSLWLALGDFFVGGGSLILALKFGYGWVRGEIVLLLFSHSAVCCSGGLLRSQFSLLCSVFVLIR